VERVLRQKLAAEVDNVINVLESFLNIPESLVAFRICEIEIDCFPNQVGV